MVTDTQDDVLCCPYSSTSYFIVKFAFNFIVGYEEEGGNRDCLWQVRYIKKVKLFLWKLFNNGFLVNAE